MVKEGRERVAIFGGSFDPPHRAHQQIAALAIEQLDIDRLIIVPAFLNPFKQSALAPPELRLAWCHTVFDPLEKVLVSDYEIRRGESTFTSQTLRHFQDIYSVNYLVIGSDNLETLTKWHAFEWLNSQITWVVATRSGSKINTEKLKRWVLLALDENVSSTHIRDTQELDTVDMRIQESVKQLLKEKNR